MSTPSVSIVIPAYNPRWFPEALTSALSQTHASLEVVVSDDSPGGAIEDHVRRIAAVDDRVVYRRNSPPAGPRDNYVVALDAARGTYVKYLNDDDLLHPDAVRRMVAVAEQDPDIAVVTSTRMAVDENGRAVRGAAPTYRLFLEDARVRGRDLLRWMLVRQLNVVGEPTTVLVRRDALESGSPDPFSVGGVGIPEPIDMALFTRLLLTGDAVYLVAPLSRFRLHAGQRQASSDSMERMLASWPALVEAARRDGLLPVEPGLVGSLRALPLGARPWWPGDVRATFEEADAALTEGDEQGAASLLDALAGVAGGRGAVWTMLGRVADLAGARRMARDAWGRAVGAAEPDPVAYLLAAEALLRRGDVAGGREHLEAASRAAPFDPRPRRALRQLGG